METGIIHNSQESIEKLKELTKEIPFAMFTTLDANGQLHSRPMTTQELDDSGCVWFFTSKNSGVTFSIENEHAVNISYSSSDKNLYISISGLAEVVDDKQKAKELWKPALKAWFPEGLEDPNLTLLKVQVQSAEYWDSPSSKLVQLAGFTKAVLTGKRYDGAGEHKRLEVN